MNNLFYKVEGGGYPLIFLHGFCETHFVWNELTALLKDQFKIITLDLPGFGESPIIKEGFTIDEVVKGIKVFLEELEIKTCILIGHSLGGYVTMSFTRQFPEMVKGFCLFNSSVYEDNPEKKENRNKLIDLIEKSGTSTFIQTFIPSLFYDKRLKEFNTTIDQLKNIGKSVNSQAVIGYAAAMRDRRDEENTLIRQKNKAMIIAGKEDKNVPLEVTMKMGGIIGMENCHVFEKTAHMAMFESKIPSAKALISFVKSKLIIDN